MDATLEASAMRKVYLRLLPFAMLCHILAYLDRINSSFAAPTMRSDLHMPAGDFGFACVLSTGGLVMAGLTMGTWWALVGMSLAAMGFSAPRDRSSPCRRCSWWIGVMKDVTGSYAGGLYGLALLGLVSAVVCALFLHIPDPTTAQERAALAPAR